MRRLVLRNHTLSNRSKIDPEIPQPKASPCASLLETAQLELYARKKTTIKIMHNTANIQNELTNCVLENFRLKARFDLSKTYKIENKAMIDEYIEDCSYAMTVILRTSSTMHVSTAQTKLHTNFNDYSIKVLGPQCLDLRKLTSRNRQFLPLIFLAFDIEGTRHNAFDVMTANPHGHGVIMFDTNTVFNFRNENARFRCEDGSYEIVNPTRDIALVKLVPFSSISGVKTYIHYSLKYAAKLLDNQSNIHPYDFYPPTSANYPFWHNLSGLALHPYSSESTGEDRHALKRIWDVDNADRCVSRNARHGKGGSPDRHSPF